MESGIRIIGIFFVKLQGILSFTENFFPYYKLRSFPSPNSPEHISTDLNDSDTQHR